MKQINLTTIIFSAMILLIAAGCSPNDSSSSEAPANPTVTDPAPNTVNEQSGGLKLLEVKAFRFGFEPSVLKVKKGDTVMIKASTIDNEHGLAIPEYDVDLKLNPSEEPKTAVFVAEKAGEFAMFCSTPCGSGHSSMKGQLIVEE